MSLDHVRAAAQAVADRAQQDPAFQAELFRDPIAALTAAGVPQEIARQLVDGDTEPEVGGYGPFSPDMPCNDTTCWSSGCPGSCAVTMCGSSYF